MVTWFWIVIKAMLIRNIGSSFSVNKGTLGADDWYQNPAPALKQFHTLTARESLYLKNAHLRAQFCCLFFRNKVKNFVSWKSKLI
jgi:hypothetical protein